MHTRLIPISNACMCIVNQQDITRSIRALLRPIDIRFMCIFLKILIVQEKRYSIPV